MSLDFHSSRNVEALSKFTMPAMSPTMTEGGLSSWKVQEGASFSAGDVILDIVSFVTWSLLDERS